MSLPHQAQMTFIAAGILRQNGFAGLGGVLSYFCSLK